MMNHVQHIPITLSSFLAGWCALFLIFIILAFRWSLLLMWRWCEKIKLMWNEFRRKVNYIIDMILICICTFCWFPSKRRIHEHMFEINIGCSNIKWKKFISSYWYHSSGNSFRHMWYIYKNMIRGKWNETHWY